jgi:hypothetical protein
MTATRQTTWPRPWGIQFFVYLPYDFELNPTELVGAQIKHHVSVDNIQLKSNLMEKLIHEGFDRVTVEKWRNYIQHVKDIEAKVWRAD